MAAAGQVPPAPVPTRPVVREAVSAQELAQGYLSEEKLARLVGGWHEHGLAILESVIPTSDLDRLAVRMDFDTAHQYVARKDKSSLPNRGDGPMAGATPGQLQQGLPHCAPWVVRSYVSNPILEQVAIAFLRGPCYMSYFNGNCCVPGAHPQGVHVDVGWRLQTADDAAEAGEPWPQMDGDNMGIFIPTRDVTIEGGATEFWPGSASSCPPATHPPTHRHHAER